MKTAFKKALRWWFLAIAVTLGSTAFMIAEETGSMRPIIFGVLGYGIAYIMGSLWKDMRGKPVGWGIGIYIVISYLSSYINRAIYILFAYNIEVNQYFLWMAALTLFGVPIMTYVFRKMR